MIEEAVEVEAAFAADVLERGSVGTLPRRTCVST